MCTKNCYREKEAIYEGERSQKTDVKRQEEERRHMKTKETMQKWLKSPTVYTFNTTDTMNIEWKLQKIKQRKVKKVLGMLSYMWNVYNNK